MELSRSFARFRGIGTSPARAVTASAIRGAESTALHIPLIEEEAMKENTAQVVAQMPVDVPFMPAKSGRTC
jgi:hypothetical protein